jgi:hypothetical protein
MELMPLRNKTGIPIQAVRRRTTLRPVFGAAAPAGTSPMLPVPYYLQEQDQWCWSACTQMVAEYMNGPPPVRQCELANFLHGQTNCCANPSSPTCNLPCPLEGIPIVYGHVGIHCLTNSWPVNAAVLLNELQQGRPVEVCYVWYATNNGHVAIIRGITPEGLYAVNDSWFGQGPCTYEFIYFAYGLGGQWRFTFGGFT